MDSKMREKKSVSVIENQVHPSADQTPVSWSLKYRISSSSQNSHQLQSQCMPNTIHPGTGSAGAGLSLSHFFSFFIPSMDGVINTKKTLKRYLVNG